MTPSLRRLAFAAIASSLASSAPVLAAPGDESVGVNAHNGTPDVVAAAAALGVAWIRLDANWNDHEPANDAYAWHLDGAVGNATAAGLKVFITLGYTPGWVPRHGDTDGSAHNDVPNGSAEWIDFVEDAVRHYRALGVRHFGLWNEANLAVFWQGTLAEYATVIVIPGAAAVRAACADCVVLGPELANVGDQADDQLEQVLRAVPPGTFDIVTHHSYNGFAETGHQIWNGDSFINMLDRQRFPFTRRSIRQVLDALGYTGEVWITETGYRATPGDATEENKQAIYVRRVMEEQLLRAWYTNTFFYEINDCGVDQPGCSIDGFGLIRPTGGSAGARSFPADFRLKPAFTAIQSFIQQNPQIVGRQPPGACGDGADNDGDGRVDLADRGCTGAGDTDESDDPPRPRIEAIAIDSAPMIDGDPTELAGATVLELGAASWRGVEPLGAAGDLGARIAIGWSQAGLHFVLEITDDVHDNTHAPAELWMGDSVQLAFDVGQGGGTGYDAIDDHEINLALTGGASSSFRFHGPTGASSAISLAVVRSGTRTTYEALLSAAVLPNVAFRAGTVIGFSFLVNDADGAGRTGWLEWTPGIGAGKEPERFGEIALVSGGARDGGVSSGDAAGARDAAPAADAGAGFDAQGGPDTDGGAGATERDAWSDGAVDPKRDANDAVDGGAPTVETSSGCGCSSSTPTHTPWPTAFIAVLVAFWIRKRLRGGHHPGVTQISRATSTGGQSLRH